jgi:hypothetical protein
MTPRDVTEAERRVRSIMEDYQGDAGRRYPQSFYCNRRGEPVLFADLRTVLAELDRLRAELKAGHDPYAKEDSDGDQ